MTPAEMIKKYIQLRNRINQIKENNTAELAPYVKVMAALEAELMRHLNDTNLDSVSGPGGTAYKQTSTSVTVEDWPLALKFIQERGMWDLLEARVAKSAAVEIIEETKKPIPGVKISQATVLRVRAG